MSAVMVLVVLAMSVPISIGSYDDYQVYSKGTLVNVVITHRENSLGFIKFTLGGKQYDKRVGKGDDNTVEYFKPGQTLQLKYLKGYEDHFLFPDENPLYSYALVLCMFLLMIFYFARYLVTGKE